MSFDTLTRVPATFQKVHYKRDRPVDLIYSRCHIHVNKRGEVAAVYWAPAFEGPLRVPPGDVIPYFRAYAAFGSAMHEMSKTRYLSESRMHVVVGDDCDHSAYMEFRTRPGDLIAFNNRRMLHGRNEFGFSHPGAGRRLLGCYVSIDDFETRVRTLCQEFGGMGDCKRLGIQNDA